MKVLAAKCDGLSLFPRTFMVEGENLALASDPCKCTVMQLSATAVGTTAVGTTGGVGTTAGQRKHIQKSAIPASQEAKPGGS